MSNWNDLLDELNKAGSNCDIIRRKYLDALNKLTGRNTIIYYSSWLQKRIDPYALSINDEDKNGFMTTINGLDKSKGLDLILHTPGGDISATESLVDYLRSIFGTNIRAIVPQLAMSAGTMIACSCEKIIMGKHSSLGPIDPQINGIPTHGIIEEFNQACLEIRQDPSKIPLWQVIVAKYNPTLIGECQKAITWSEKIVKDWLVSGMFKGQADAQVKAANVVKDLGSHALTLSHARHFSADTCKRMGLDVVMLEDDQKLQNAVLTVHHACMHTLTSTPAVKIIENHNGTAFIQTIQQGLRVQ